MLQRLEPAAVEEYSVVDGAIGRGGVVDPVVGAAAEGVSMSPQHASDGFVTPREVCELHESTDSLEAPSPVTATTPVARAASPGGKVREPSCHCLQQCTECVVQRGTGWRQQQQEKHLEATSTEMHDDFMALSARALGTPPSSREASPMLQRLKPALKQQGITTSDSAREALAFLASLQQSSSGDNTGQLAETMCKVVELETKLADAEKAGAKHRAELEAQEQKLLEQSAAQQAMLLEEMTSAALLAWNERQKEQDAMMIAEREANNRVWQAEVRKKDQLLEVKEVEKARLQLEAAARVASLETSMQDSRAELSKSNTSQQQQLLVEKKVADTAAYMKPS